MARGFHQGQEARELSTKRPDTFAHDGALACVLDQEGPCYLGQAIHFYCHRFSGVGLTGSLSGNTEAGVVVEAAPAATFIVPEAKLLLEFLIVPLDEPTRLGRMGQSLQTRLRRQGAESVFARFGFVPRPFNYNHSSSRSRVRL